ncbi:hypothetical protein [Knoellia sp. p5-6-4]|uniref:hypothetical protein n=1 Tax=unclassified Knoellia TaxID=2618719 RepID=UPI0023DA97F5|nr:hypothetical protein [Knoellia sp. p5-6-4]MDF2144810.1 hypothetical protein [Knoellia sp. p5-6-4]
MTTRMVDGKTASSFTHGVLAACLSAQGRPGDALVVVGIPFGHTRPQWILPYGAP